MSRTKKVFRLKKRGDVWYYKTEDMDNFKSTGLTSKEKAEKEVINLIKNNSMRIVKSITKQHRGIYEKKEKLLLMYSEISSMKAKLSKNQQGI